MQIRPGEVGDLERINGFYNHYVRTSPVTFDIDEISAEARREWFESFDERRYRLVVAAEDGICVGYAHSKPFRPKQAYETSVESTVYVAPEALGRGLGAAMYEALLSGLAGEDVHRVYAGITMPNDASVSLHESFGFKRVAYFTEQGRKFGRYWDVAWFEKEM